jgi:apolipoprotein N-acyltransferase
LTASLLVWAALPPVDAWPLAWIATVPWILLVRRTTLPGRRPYRSLWLAGFVFWMATLHWLRLPHWATSFGWVALSFYLAFYVPLFVGLSRVAVHRLGVSVVAAAPVVFAGLELARAHVLGGFSMGALAHTQHRWIALVQLADLAGEYSVTFLVVLVAACVARMLPLDGRRWAVWPAVLAVLAVSATLVYGTIRAGFEPSTPGPRVALIQGSIDTELKFDPARELEVHEHYLALTRRALSAYTDLDLIVWPETMFRSALVTFEPGAPPPAEWDGTPEKFTELINEAGPASRMAMGSIARGCRLPVVLGVDTLHYGRDRLHRYNSAAYMDAQGNLLARYDKVHPVMFGEYVPLADRYPWLAQLTPLRSSLDFGAGPVSFELGKFCLAPDICYESVLSHLIRGQVNRLAAAGRPPDVLLNLTNDGWFWGSSELDLHLRCGVFRAIECRRPLLAAANTGFSAWIDSNGRIVKQGPRRAPATLLADVRLDGRTSPYLAYGDIPAGGCLLICGLLALVGIRRKPLPSKPLASV